MFKIAIFTSEDYIFFFNAWCDFTNKSAGRHKIVGIFVFPDRVKGKKGWRMYFEYLKMMGATDFFKLSLAVLWKKIKNINSRYADFMDLGRKNNIPVFRFESPNEPAVVEWIKKNEIDIICLTVSDILKMPIIRSVKRCVLNKHSAFLPAYRGLWPVFWTLKDGVLPVVASIHTVDAKIDQGEIILQKIYSMEKKSVFDWYAEIYKDMADLFLRALDNLESGQREKAESVPAPSYFSLPTRAEYKEFKKKGLKFV